MSESMNKSAVLGLAITTATLRVSETERSNATDATTFDPEYVKDIINLANGYMNGLALMGRLRG